MTFASWTNLGRDRTYLAAMAEKAKAEMSGEDPNVVADFDGEEVMACEAAGVVPIVPKPDTSSAKADGRLSKSDFVYEPETDVYRCPAGERSPSGSRLSRTGERYGATGRACVDLPAVSALHARTAVADLTEGARGATRGDAQAPRGHARRHDDAPVERRARLRHPEAIDGNGDIPHQGPRNVGTEMSLSVLAYNLKRTIGIRGFAALVAALRN